MVRLLNHLAFDDEMFWISAVLGGDEQAIGALRDGWASDPMTGSAAIEAYERKIGRSDKILSGIDLDALNPNAGHGPADQGPPQLGGPPG